MIHLGDITKIEWSTVPPVDCVTGGSPCQDLSVAGKRAGLAGERSGLYMEQIRCIRELRKADEKRGRTNQFIRPRYMVWENVPGAFSSNKGKDFAAVLEEAVKVIEPEAPAIPVPEGGWPYSGCLTDGVAGKWSVAWRVHDAQFWGVPQRRRRIALVCDFGGQSAQEILFERKGVSWNPQEGGAQREEVAGGTGKSAEKSIWCIGNGQANQSVSDKAGALNTMHDQQAVMVLNDQGGSVMDVSNESTATLRAQSHGHEPAVMNQSVVRRLTPLECERLQGYPDGWTDIGEWTDSKGKRHKAADTPRYKALGNSIALPFWFWLLRRIASQYYRPATLGSLFDGIGGFPLCWERCNGPGTALWASEIEEFPMAVTKLRFPETT